MELRMSPNEACLFRSFVSRAASYVEFGAGGSTVFAAGSVKGPVYSVESDEAWISKVRESMPSSEFERHLIFADIGPTKEWGYPALPHGDVDYLNYHQSLWSRIPSACNFYFVDGRFRVACFCQSLLRADDRSFLAMHDFRSRPPYHVVEKLAEIVAEADDLTVFRRSQFVSKENILETLDQYKHVPV